MHVNLGYAGSESGHHVINTSQNGLGGVEHLGVSLR